MSIVTLPNIGSGSDPATINVSVLNGKVDPLATDYNGNIQNVNIAAAAGIVYSKLTLTDGIVNADINSSAAIANSKLNLASIAQLIQMSSKAIDFAKGSDIASATTTDIGAMVGNYGDVTGTTTITGLGTIQAGTFRMVRFTGALTLTHNGTSLLLPGAANITTAANDTAGFVSLGSGNWKCVWYQKYSGVAVVGGTAATALSGSVVQTVNTQSGAVATGTTTLPDDDTIPQSTEGTEYITRAITPNNTSNLLRIDVLAVVAFSSTGIITMALFQDSTADALAATQQTVGSFNDGQFILKLTHYMTAGTTSSTTFKIRIGSAGAGTLTFNGVSAARKMGGVMASSINIMEIKA